MPPDTLLELIRIVGEVGWNDLADRVRASATAGRPHVEASADALARLSIRSDAGAWNGLWLSDGLDVLEVNPEVRVPEWRAVYAGEIFGPSVSAEMAIGDDGVAEAGGVRWRMIWVPRQGETGTFHALQTDDGRTFYKLDGLALISAVSTLHESLAHAHPDCLKLAASSLEVEETEDAKSPKPIKGSFAARAILHWRAADAAGAIEILTEVTQGKKPRADDVYWLGVIQADAGDSGAKATLKKYLKVAAKKAPNRSKAQELLAGL